MGTHLGGDRVSWMRRGAVRMVSRGERVLECGKLEVVDLGRRRLVNLVEKR